MEDVRRWFVTYTKHMKQKRKVYQDGFLALYSASRKAKLYDESENVLEVRMLKSDEVVKAGETLTLHSHIVDVGDCEDGDAKASGNVKTENKERNLAHSFGVRPVKKFRSPITDSCKIKEENDEPPAFNQSPSQKLIREFKKTELQKYVVAKRSPVTHESSATEWAALYSTQTLKKAKIYHDGYVNLVSSGLRGRKVMLYDSRRNLLNSRFLKSDELVKSGEPLSFDGHIVEIGELEVDKPGDDNAVEENNSKSAKELINCRRLKKTPGRAGTNPNEVPHKDGSSADLSDNKNSNISNSEWLVLYTTQLTQKAKKFHDGFLSLTHYGSMRKVMLFDISRQLLDSRFLRRDEYISPSEPLSVGGHLVNVGEPNKASKTLIGYNNVASLSTTTSPVDIRGTNKITVKDASPRYSCTRHVKGPIAGSTCTDDNRSSYLVPTNKPLRDVSGILSSLQRPCSNDVTSDGPTSAVEHLPKHSHFQSPLKRRPSEEFSNQTGTVKSSVGDNLFVYTEFKSPYGFGDPASLSVHESNIRLEEPLLANLGVMNERELKTNEKPLLAKPAVDICSKGNLATLSLTKTLTHNSSHILEKNEAENLKEDMVVELLPSSKPVESPAFDNQLVVNKTLDDMDGWPSFDLGFE